MNDKEAQLIFEIYSEGMDRRKFLSMLGRGASAFATVPWTKLLSAPKIAAAVTAPFKIGAGTMLNPEALHWYYVHKFYNKALESGLTPVDVTDERHYEYEHTEISAVAFEWVSKNIINMYVDDVGHSTDREGSTVAPTLSELINHMGEEKEHFIDDPNFPEWAKPLLAKDEEDMTDEEEERYQNLMNSKWFDKQMVINWDGEWGHGADEEIEELLGNWMRWHPDKSPVGDGENELINTVFDYIIHLNDKRMDINEIMKMDFKQEFLPGVVKYANAMAVNPGGNIEYEPDAQRAADVDTSAGGLERQRRPGQERSEQEYWDDRFHAFSDEELVEEYKAFAQMILNNSDNPRFSDPKLQKEAQMFLDELEHRYSPKDIPSKHPLGVGRPQSGLQTMSYRPTFKQYFKAKKILNEFTYMPKGIPADGTEGAEILIRIAKVTEGINIMPLIDRDYSAAQISHLYENWPSALKQDVIDKLREMDKSYRASWARKPFGWNPVSVISRGFDNRPNAVDFILTVLTPFDHGETVMNQD